MPHPPCPTDNPSHWLLEDFHRGTAAPQAAKRPHALPQTPWHPPEPLLTAESVRYDPGDPGAKMLIGAIGERLIGIDDPRHVLTVAGSRTGKSVTIIANLLCYRGSVLAIDPKGELANKTARRRARHFGQEVYVIDPFNQTHGVAATLRRTFNPLAVLRPESETLIEDINLITDALVISTDRDQHWDESARSLLQGLVLHTITAPELLGARDLLTVRELLTEGCAFTATTDAGQTQTYQGMEGLQKAMVANAAALRGTPAEDAGILIGRAAADLWERPETERQSVLSTARRHTNFLEFSSMRESLIDGGQLDLRTLKRAPHGATIYLCVPASRLGMLNRWFRLFINLALSAMESEPTRPRVPVLFVLDEFPVLGYMKQLEDAAGQIASYHVRLWIILQDLGQLQALYKDRWQTFFGNAGIAIFHGNNDLTTLEYLQRRCGKTAVLVTSYGETGHGKDGAKGESHAWQVQDLITAEEASRYFGRDDPKKRQLVIWATHLPMVMQRVEYHDRGGPFWPFFRDTFDD